MYNLGIMPAAGCGTRLYPFKGAKELLPLGQQIINGEIRPKIVSQYGFEAMKLAGVEHIIIPTTPKKAESFTDCFSDGKNFGVNISYLITDYTPSMVKTINLVLKNHREDRIFFSMPDTCILPTNCFDQLLEKHLVTGSQLSLGLFHTSESYKYGMVDIDQKNEIIYHEDKPKDTSTKLMWGIAIWEPSFTEFILSVADDLSKNKIRELSFGDVIDKFMGEGNIIHGFVIENGRYYDVGTYEGYKKAITEL